MFTLGINTGLRGSELLRLKWKDVLSPEGKVVRILRVLQTKTEIIREIALGPKARQAITDLLDIYPTIVDLAGLEVPDYLDGVTLRQVLNQPELTQRRNKEGSISRWMNGESVRTDKYRYTRWFDKEGQTTDQMLFDLVADPREQFNLAEKSASAEVVSALGGILERQQALPVWSDKLETQYGLWRLAAKPSAGVLLLALTYPVTALVILLLILMAAIAFWRSRRKRAQ